jgi:NAD(P)-dependent dehydrogenase (short-subunit alcohol dehydrogenase family)
MAAKRRWEGKVVVVTGGSAGVGRAVVRQFARAGAKVALIARGEDGLEAAKQDVARLGGQALVLPLDVADAEALERAAEQVERELGPIDVWVNNAMTSVFSPALQMTPDEFKRVTEVTYLGYVHGTLAALRRMKVRNRGTIVQVSSALAYRGIPLQSAYCAAKHAIVGFTESLRCELLHDGVEVHVTMVHLPAVNTPQFGWVRSRLPNKAQPVPPIFQPEVAARAIEWSARHRRRALSVGWPVVQAILGNKIIPGLLDRYLAQVAYDGQQTDEPRSKDAPDNLHQPVPGDHGAHGTFDQRARGRSVQAVLSRHRWAVALGGLAAAVATAGALRPVWSR